MKKTTWLLILLITLTVITGCHGKSTATDTDGKQLLKLGTSPGPYSELFLQGILPILEKQGYKIETTEFQELLQADVALSEGSIDLNVDQHSAYLNNFNENSQTHLVSLTPIPTVAAGIFPGRKTSLADIKEGDKIGIPDDPSNTARAYNLLQKANLITLKEGTDPIKATAQDIVENQKKLDIIEMKSSQIPRSLEDLDYAVIPGSIVYSSKIAPTTKLLSEDVLQPYELIVAVDQKNKNTQWAKDIVTAYHSKEFKEYLAKENQNNYWFIPDKLK